MADTFSDALAAVSNQFKNPVPTAAPAGGFRPPPLTDDQKAQLAPDPRITGLVGPYLPGGQYANVNMQGARVVPNSFVPFSGQGTSVAASPVADQSNQHSPLYNAISNVIGAIPGNAAKMANQVGALANVPYQFVAGTQQGFDTAKNNPALTDWFGIAAQEGKKTAAPTGSTPTVSYGVGNGELEPSVNGQYDVGRPGKPYTSTPEEVALAAKHLGVTPEQAHAVINAHTQSENDFLNAVRGMPRNQMNALVGHAMQLRMDPRTQLLRNYSSTIDALRQAGEIAADKTQPDDVRARAQAAITNPALQTYLQNVERVIAPGTMYYQPGMTQ